MPPANRQLPPHSVVKPASQAVGTLPPTLPASQAQVVIRSVLRGTGAFKPPALGPLKAAPSAVTPGTPTSASALSSRPHTKHPAVLPQSSTVPAVSHIAALISQTVALSKQAQLAQPSTQSASMATSSKVHALDPTVQPTLQASRSNTPRLSSDTVARYAPVSSAQPAARKAPDTGKPPVGLALQAVAAAEHKLPRTSTGPAVASAHVHATADAAPAMGIGAGMRMQRPSAPCADASGATARRTAAASSLQEVSPAPPKACTSILLASGRWSHTASLPAAAGGSSAQEPSSRSVHAAKACSTSVAQGPASLPADAAAESASPPPAVTSLLSLSPPRTVRHSPTAPDPDVLRSPVLSQGAVLSPHARVRMVCKPPRDAPAAAAVATSPAQITNSKSDNSCVLPGSKRATVGHATLAASPIQSSHLSFPEEQAGESCNLHASISVNQDEQTSSTEPTTAPPHTCSKRAAAAAAPAAPCNDQHATDHAASSVPGCWKEGWASNAHGSVDAVDLDMYEGWELTVPELDPASGTQACHPLPDLASIAGAHAEQEETHPELPQTPGSEADTSYSV
ncbi:MAG: hypothetical protein WDW38_006338 [Sanguina aurantia]